MKGFIKDPDAVLDYSFDWEPWLAGDTISTSVWVAESPLVVDSDSNTTLITTVWISGGDLDSDYTLLNSITTAAGRSEDRTVSIRIRAR